MPTIGELYKASRIDEIQQAVMEMEWTGFAIDIPYFNAQAAIADQHRLAALEDLRAGLVDLGIQRDNPEDIWASPKQLIGLLHDDPDGLKLPPSPFWFKGRVKVDDGERKTDRVALEWVASRCTGPHAPAGRIVNGLMGLRRIVSSAKYLEKLPRYVGADGFVHPVSGPAGDEDDRVGAVTGRLGMKAPEAQQIPRDPRKDAYQIRKGFIAPEGMTLVVRDFTALEVVILGNICDWMFGDSLLLDLTAEGRDVHAYNAHQVFGKFLKWKTPSGRALADISDLSLFKSDPEIAWYRDAIKAVFYKLMYGGTVHGFATSLRDQAGEPVGMARAEEIVQALFEALPPIPKWQAYVAKQLRAEGGICALDGRFVDLKDLIARDEGSRKQWAFDAACRKAVNFPMQATGAHVIGCAMVDAMNCSEMRRLGAVLELQVHDELRWRCPEANAQKVYDLAGEIMRNAFPLKNLRTAGGMGRTWADAK